jgi:hypothetical protein
MIVIWSFICRLSLTSQNECTARRGKQATQYKKQNKNGARKHQSFAGIRGKQTPYQPTGIFTHGEKSGQYICGEDARLIRYTGCAL